MNFQPPDVPYSDKVNGTQNKGTSSFSRRPNYQDCSPLLRTTFQNKNFDNDTSKPPLNRNNLNTTRPVRNRLGNRNFHRYNNNINNNTLPDNNESDNNSSHQRNFNRKRINDGNLGPAGPKRKWGNSRNNFYSSNSNHTNQQHSHSVQNRLQRIRSNTQLDQVADDDSPPQNGVEEEETTLNDSQTIDATDITIEVINSAAQVKEETALVRFKMVLDPKAQNAIRVIQAKRKDKQVIFPYPVTPNVTAITLNERFGML